MLLALRRSTSSSFRPNRLAHPDKCRFMCRSMSSCTTGDRSCWSRSTKKISGWKLVTRKCLSANMHTSSKSCSCRDTSPLWLISTSCEQAMARSVIWPSNTSPDSPGFDSIDNKPSVSSTTRSLPSSKRRKEA